MPVDYTIARLLGPPGTAGRNNHGMALRVLHWAGVGRPDRAGLPPPPSRSKGAEPGGVRVLPDEVHI